MKTGLIAIVLVSSLVGMLGSGGAQAADYDGNSLLLQCQQYIKAADSEKNYDRVDAALCLGFLQGVQSSFSFLSDDLKEEAKFCLPNGVTNGQITRIVVKYLKDNPKLLNKNRMGLVWLALTDAYPCK